MAVNPLVVVDLAAEVGELAMDASVSQVGF
jgi:hypothetical protein